MHQMITKIILAVLCITPVHNLWGESVKHEFLPLPYDYDALDVFVDATTMEIHYDRHHRAYFNNFMGAVKETPIEGWSFETLFSRMDEVSESIRNNAGGVFNHDLFWAVMSPDGGGEPSGSLAKAIDRDFGSLKTFKETFEQAGATRFGSGWAWLSVDENGKLFVSSTPNQDNPLMNIVSKQGTPILGLDVWEHAYYLRYQNRRGSYISAFWKVVNWPEVERRYLEALP